MMFLAARVSKWLKPIPDGIYGHSNETFSGEIIAIRKDFLPQIKQIYYWWFLYKILLNYNP